MAVFKFLPLTFLPLVALLLLMMVAHSCFPPNGLFDKNKKTACIFFIPKTMQIWKTCNDGNVGIISGPVVSVKYDTIKIVNGRHSDRSTLFGSYEKVEFPYDLNTIIKDRSKEVMIGLTTDKGNGYSYSLDIHPEDWVRDTLFFVFYYR